MEEALLPTASRGAGRNAGSRVQRPRQRRLGLWRQGKQARRRGCRAHPRTVPCTASAGACVRSGTGRRSRLHKAQGNTRVWSEGQARGGDPSQDALGQRCTSATQAQPPLTRVDAHWPVCGQLKGGVHAGGQHGQPCGPCLGHCCAVLCPVPLQRRRPPRLPRLPRHGCTLPLAPQVPRLRGKRVTRRTPQSVHGPASATPTPPPEKSAPHGAQTHPPRRRSAMVQLHVKARGLFGDNTPKKTPPDIRAPALVGFTTRDTQRSEDHQFLYDTPAATPLADLCTSLARLHNARLGLLHLCSTARQAATHTGSTPVEQVRAVCASCTLQRRAAAQDAHTGPFGCVSLCSAVALTRTAWLAALCPPRS